jgi:hypothetical protein
VDWPRPFASTQSTTRVLPKGPTTRLPDRMSRKAIELGYTHSRSSGQARKRSLAWLLQEDGFGLVAVPKLSQVPHDPAANPPPPPMLVNNHPDNPPILLHRHQEHLAPLVDQAPRRTLPCALQPIEARRIQRPTSPPVSDDLWRCFAIASLGGSPPRPGNQSDPRQDPPPVGQGPLDERPTEGTKHDEASLEQVATGVRYGHGRSLNSGPPCSNGRLN